MKRRTHAQVAKAAAAEAVATDRKAVVAYAATYCGQVDAMISKGRLAAEEGALLKDRIRVFAGNVAAGLHLP